MQEMRANESMMSVWEAEERARRGANELEEVINKFNGELSMENEVRHEDLYSHFMSLLAGTYGIAAPGEVTIE